MNMKLPSLVALIALLLLAAPVMGSSSSDLISHRKIIKLNEKVEQIKNTATQRQQLPEKNHGQRSLIDGTGISGGGAAVIAAAAAAAAAAGDGANKDAAGDQYHGTDMNNHHSRDAVAWLNTQNVPPPENN